MTRKKLIKQAREMLDKGTLTMKAKQLKPGEHYAWKKNGVIDERDILSGIPYDKFITAYKHYGYELVKVRIVEVKEDPRKQRLISK